MSRALYIGAAGLAAHQFQVDVLAHNLANLGTVGFRRSRAEFTEEMTGAAGATDAVGGVRVQGTAIDGRLGALLNTGRDLDLAINGAGFFRLSGTDGDRYTRAGSFALAADGTIAGPGGLRLADAAGIIRLPAGASAVTVTADGTINASVAGRQVRLDRPLVLAMPPAPEAMAPVGGNLWQALLAPALVTPGAGGAGSIAVGSLENANVDLGEEMTALLQAMRYYQLSGRTLRAAEDITTAALGMWRP